MPFIPHSEQDQINMLARIGAQSIDDLFDEIPAALRDVDLSSIPSGMTEQQITRLMHQRAAADPLQQCFIGAGSYDHHIPAVVWEITTRGEFYSAYTPYQAEASQGTLQLLYEYQTMMASLTGLGVSNASLYDGGTAVAEAVLMAVRANRKSKSKRVLLAGALHPHYREVVSTIVRHQKIELIELAIDDTGCVSSAALAEHEGTDIAALVIQQPNFFGRLEDVDALTDWAHAQKALVIGSVNPTALALLTAPGEWGENGADMACGDGQPLGVPMSSGGPYFGFLTCKQALVRQMPGRIIGRTVDMDGTPGYTLTLQAREQHIRRSKATSNICTNQGLLVTAATIYMSLLGAEGLKRVAAESHSNIRKLTERLTALEGVELRFAGPVFHEVALRLSKPVDAVLAGLRERGIDGGYALGRKFADLEDCLLICTTETKTADDLAEYAEALAAVLEAL